MMLERFGDRFVAVLEIIAARDTQPVVFHCAAGKDRTGLVAMLLLGVLGVDPEIIAADYAVTDARMPVLLERHQARAAEGAAAEVAEQKWAVDATAMRAVVDRLVARHGSVEGYVRAHGIAPDALMHLRDSLLEDPAARLTRSDRIGGMARFSHVGQCVRDLEATRAFYVEVLGFEEVMELDVSGSQTAKLLRLAEPVEMQAVYLRRDGFVLELLAFTRPEPLVPRGRPIDRAGAHAPVVRGRRPRRRLPRRCSRPGAPSSRRRGSARRCSSPTPRARSSSCSPDRNSPNDSAGSDGPSLARPVAAPVGWAWFGLWVLVAGAERARPHLVRRRVRTRRHPARCRCGVDGVAPELAGVRVRAAHGRGPAVPARRVPEPRGTGDDLLAHGDGQRVRRAPGPAALAGRRARARARRDRRPGARHPGRGRSVRPSRI